MDITLLVADRERLTAELAKVNDDIEAVLKDRLTREVEIYYESYMELSREFGNYAWTDCGSRYTHIDDIKILPNGLFEIGVRYDDPWDELPTQWTVYLHVDPDKQENTRNQLLDAKRARYEKERREDRQREYDKKARQLEQLQRELTSLPVA